MSGGSYNYLCYCDGLSELLDGHMSDLRSMADDLAALGYAEDAAAETEELICMVNQASVRIETRIKRLRAIWKAREWWVSCDSSEDDFKEALAKYREITDTD
jgi:hypothetical protein